MIDSLRKPTRRWLLAAVVVTVSGCASSGSREQPAAAAPPTAADAVLFGVAGDHFVAIDPRSGITTDVATSDDLSEVGALTYDPASRTFYAVARSATDPELIAIDRDTGSTRTIGPIDMPTLDLTLVEGLAFDASDGILYATGDRSGFFSERLLAIDPESGKARMLGRVRGTAQNDVDALIAIAGKLYGIDVVGHSSTLYQIDKRSAGASLRAQRFPRSVTDLAFDPDSRLLLAPVENHELLLAMAPGGEIRELGLTRAETGIEAGPINAIACVTAATGLFADDFESGDLSLWEAPDALLPEGEGAPGR